MSVCAGSGTVKYSLAQRLPLEVQDLQLHAVLHGLVVDGPMPAAARDQGVAGHDRVLDLLERDQRVVVLGADDDVDVGGDAVPGEGVMSCGLGIELP